MKKQFLIIGALLLSFAVTQELKAQVYYVRIQPPAPVIVRPAPPTPHHVWVEHEWVWKNGAYIHVPGYWVVPPRGHLRWKPGHWSEEPGHGYHWIPGHWV